MLISRLDRAGTVCGNSLRLENRVVVATSEACNNSSTRGSGRPGHGRNRLSLSACRVGRLRALIGKLGRAGMVCGNRMQPENPVIDRKSVVQGKRVGLGGRSIRE